MDGESIDGMTFAYAVTRGSTVKVFRGEYYYNYIEFKNDGNSIISNAVNFYVPGECDIYVTAYTTNSKNCWLVVGGYSMLATPEVQTIKYSYSGSAGNVRIYIEPYSSVNDFAKIRIFNITAVPKKTYSQLGENEELYWNFDNFEFTGITDGIIRSDYTESGLTIHASADKTVSVLTNEKDTEAGYRYSRAVDLDGSGCNSYRSISFFAYPDSDIFITAYRAGSSAERTLYFTNDYGVTFYDDNGISQDIKVNDEATLYKITYNGGGETVHFCSADSSIRICDIRIIKKEENDTSLVENGSWNFANCENGDISSETVLNGLTIIPGRRASIMKSSESGYSKYLRLYYAPYNDAAKLKFTIGDSTGSDKYRSNKIISITVKGASHSGSMLVVDKYGRLITKFNFTKNLATYNLQYDGYSKDLFFYSTTETPYVYELSVKDVDEYFGEVFDIASVSKSNTYTYYCSVYNISDVEDNAYIVSYNQNALEVTYVGYGDESASYNGINIRENITIVSNADGFLEFKVSGDLKNWSGVLASVEFQALSTGNTTVGFDYYEG